MAHLTSQGRVESETTKKHPIPKLSKVEEAFAFEVWRDVSDFSELIETNQFKIELLPWIISSAFLSYLGRRCKC